MSAEARTEIGASLSQAADLVLALNAIEQCQKCRNVRTQLLRAMDDVRSVVRKRARGARTVHSWEALIAKEQAVLVTNVEFALAHLDLPHAEAQPRAATSRRVPKPADDRPTCPSCGSRVNVTDNRIAAHTASSGNACKRRLMEPPKVVAPPVHLPPVPHPPSRHVAERAQDNLSRLDGGSECRECGRWLPGERQLCGSCFVQVSR